MNYGPRFQWNHYQMDAVIDNTHTHAVVNPHLHTPTLVSIPLWYMGGIRCQFPAEKKKVKYKNSKWTGNNPLLV